MLLIGAFGISMADNVLRPLLLSGRTSISGLVIFFGLLGGVAAFGFIGLVIGPIILVTTARLLKSLHRPDLRDDAVPAKDRVIAESQEGDIMQSLRIRFRDDVVDRYGGALPTVSMIAILSLLTGAGSLRGQGQLALPPRFDAYVKMHVKLTTEELKQLLAGQPVSRLLDTDSAKEVSIFGAVWST